MVRVLIVDDSAVVRQMLSKELAQSRHIEVVGTAMDPYLARDKILALKPDVVTLDLEMPRMDGLTFLKKLMRYLPLPVIIVSSLTPAGSKTALEALRLGAVEVVSKPGSAYSVKDVAKELEQKILAAASSRPLRQPTSPEDASAPPSGAALSRTTHQILAIGASTGGTRAIEDVLLQLPPDTPGSVIVQHMPEAFTASFSERLNEVSQMEVREAEDGDPVVTGVALVAPGGRHMVLERCGARYVVATRDGPPVHYQRPSVDVLFHSVARQAGPNAVGVILTGMGADGASGLLAMREAGAHTIAQDEKSSVVFGMPREAIKRNAADEIASLGSISERIVTAFTNRQEPTVRSGH